MPLSPATASPTGNRPAGTPPLRISPLFCAAAAIAILPTGRAWVSAGEIANSPPVRPCCQILIRRNPFAKSLMSLAPPNLPLPPNTGAIYQLRPDPDYGGYSPRATDSPMPALIAVTTAIQAYALIELPGSTRIITIHDRVNRLFVTSIGPHGVRLSDGSIIRMKGAN